MNFGVDMLSIGATGFHVQTLKGWGVKSGNKVGDDLHVFGRTSDGLTMEGAGYFLNRTDKGEGSPNKCTWEATPHGLFATVNPSTLVHGWSLTTDLEPALNAVRHDMNLLGLDFDLEGTSVNRVDLTRQAVMKSPTASFHSTFSALEGKRMKHVQYPDGYTFGNRQKEVVFYDKHLQLLKVKGIDDAPPNLLRCEARWKKRKVIGHDVNGLGVGTFSDLLGRSSSDLFGRYSRFLETNIFRAEEGKQLSFDFADEVEVIRSFVNEAERNGWMNYVMAKGTENILLEFGSLDLFGEALVQVGYHPKHVQRVKKRLRSGLMKQAIIDRNQKRDTLTASIDTLRRTFTA